MAQHLESRASQLRNISSHEKRSTHTTSKDESRSRCKPVQAPTRHSVVDRFYPAAREGMYGLGSPRMVFLNCRGTVIEHRAGHCNMRAFRFQTKSFIKGMTANVTRTSFSFLTVCSAPCSLYICSYHVGPSPNRRWNSENSSQQQAITIAQ